MKQMNKNIVIVNKSFDGYASGYAAWKKFKDNAVYLVSGYDQPIPEIKIDKNTDIYIMDFIYSKEIMADLVDRAASVIVLEHNKTVPDDYYINDCPFMFISSPDYSSCVTSWNYFHAGIEVPKPLLLLQDRNLWLFKFEDSENFHLGLLGTGLTTNYLMWDLIAQDSYFFTDIINKGKIINEYKKHVIEDFIECNRVEFIEYEGYKGLLFNCVNFISETSNELLEINPDVDFTISYQTFTDRIRFDIRSRNGGDLDASTLAKKMGNGGGNMNSAGFIFKTYMLQDISCILSNANFNAISFAN